MKQYSGMITGLCAVLLAGYVAYTTTRLHDLDARLHAAEVRLQAADTALARASATWSRQVATITPPDSALEERVRRLEEDRRPKMRLLSESGNR